MKKPVEWEIIEINIMFHLRRGRGGGNIGKKLYLPHAIFKIITKHGPCIPTVIIDIMGGVKVKAKQTFLGIFKIN